MEYTAKQIAEFIGGTVEGDEQATVYTFSKIEEGFPGALSFLSNPKYTHYIYNTKSTIVLVDNSLELTDKTQTTLIRCKNAYEAIARLMSLYEQMRPKKQGISSLANIAKSAIVPQNCYIGPFVVIGENVKIGIDTQIYPNTVIGDGVTIGDKSIIYPNVTIYNGCQLGNRVILHSGCVIGADGFGFAPSEIGYEKIPQIGIVTIEDNVEIGANTCIDRSTMGSTYIRKGVKLDNLVQIAHNVDVGKHTVMSAQVGVAGSTKIGEWCMFGGQVGIVGHAVIGDHTQSGAQAGIAGSLPKGNTTIQGSPAIDAKNFARSSIVFKNLPQMFADLNKMKKEIQELRSKLANAEEKTKINN